MWISNRTLGARRAANPHSDSCRAVPGTSTSKGGLSSPPELGPFFLGGNGSWRGGAARWVVVYQTNPAAVGSAFWSRGAIQPVPGLFFGPTGNSVAPGGSRARVRAHVALGRFGATHRRGVGSSTQTDQETQGQNRSHRVCSIRSTDRERIIRVRDSTSVAIAVVSFNPIMCARAATAPSRTGLPDRSNSRNYGDMPALMPPDRKPPSRR